MGSTWKLKSKITLTDRTHQTQRFLNIKSAYFVAHQSQYNASRLSNSQSDRRVFGTRIIILLTLPADRKTD